MSIIYHKISKFRNFTSKMPGLILLTLLEIIKAIWDGFRGQLNSKRHNHNSYNGTE